MIKNFIPWLLGLTGLSFGAAALICGVRAFRHYVGGSFLELYRDNADSAGVIV